MEFNAHQYITLSNRLLSSLDTCATSFIIQYSFQLEKREDILDHDIRARSDASLSFLMLSSQPQSWLSLLAPWMLESPSFSSSFGLVQRASSSTVSCLPSIVFDDRSVFKCSLLLMTDSIHSCIAAVFSSAGAFGSKLIDAINFLIHVISPTFRSKEEMVLCMPSTRSTAVRLPHLSNWAYLCL